MQVNLSVNKNGGAQNEVQASERSIDKIKSIFRDGGGMGKIRNQNLQQKTEEIQKEFEMLMD